MTNVLLVSRVRKALRTCSDIGRCHLRKVVAFLKGRSLVKKHMHNVGLSYSNPDSRVRKMDSEGVHHIISRC
jgi:hypothetical protein